MTAKKLMSSSLIPEDTRRAFADAYPIGSDDQRLFLEIVARAVMDAYGVTGHERSATRHNSAVRDARLWFKMGDNVDEYFEYAQVNMKRVVEPILAMDPYAGIYKKATDPYYRVYEEEMSGKEE